MFGQGIVPTFLYSSNFISASDLENFIDVIIQSRKEGISLIDADSDQESWTIGQSILFTVTLVTTIGKGKDISCLVKHIS